MIRQMLTKKKLLQLLMVIGSTLMYVPLLMNEIMSIREFGIIIVVILIATAYIEYRRRKIIAQFSRYTDEKLKEQARKFRGEVSKTVQARAWGDDELDALMDMIGEFKGISPFDSSRHQPVAPDSNKKDKYL